MASNQPAPTFAVLPGQQQHQQQAPAYSQVPPPQHHRQQQQQQQQHYQHYQQQEQPPSQPGYNPSYPPQQQQQQRPPPQQQQQVTPPHSGGAVLPQPPPVLMQPKNRTPNVKARLDDQPLMTRTPDEETEDGRLRNREAVAKIRETWIYKQVRARQNEFTQYRKVCNVYGRLAEVWIVFSRDEGAGALSVSVLILDSSVPIMVDDF